MKESPQLASIVFLLRPLAPILLAVITASGCSSGSSPNQAVGDRAEQASSNQAAGDRTDQLPPAETPVEQTYVDLIELYRRQAAVLASISNAATAQQHAQELGQMMDQEYALMVRLAELGAEKPPRGAPQKYREHFRVANDERQQHDVRISGSSDQALTAVLTEIAAQHARDREDPFRVDAAIRSAGQDKLVTVTLANNRALLGPRHQRMVRMLMEQAGATNSQVQIDGSAYRVLLSPVEDFKAFAERVSLGKVSDVDATARSFTLTIDPAAIPEDVSEGGPATPGFARTGQPGRPRVMPGPDAGPRARGGPQAAGSPAAGGGRTFHVKMIYDGYSGSKELKDQLETSLSRLSEYVPDTLELDEATNTVRFQIRRRFDLAAFGRVLRDQGLRVSKMNMGPKPPQ